MRGIIWGLILTALLFGVVKLAVGEDLLLPDWKTQMVAYGQNHCVMQSTNPITDQQLASIYYDSAFVYYQARDITGNSSWNHCAKRAVEIYRDYYVIPNNGGVPGYWNFTRGLREDWIRTSDPKSKQAIQLLSANGKYCWDYWDARQYLPTYEAQRENAYCGEAHLDNYKIGGGLTPRLKSFFLENALGHNRQFFLDKTTPWTKPFMAGLEASFLIRYYHEVEADARILASLKMVADSMWTNGWDPVSESFWYVYPATATEPQEASPDLNLLIAPMYQWLYLRTGNIDYKNKATTIFNSGVLQAWLVNGKQYNQNYRDSGIFAASAPTGIPTIAPTATRTPTVRPTATATPKPLCNLTQSQLNCLGGK